MLKIKEMRILDNFPTVGYIKIDKLTIDTEHGEYNVDPCYTNKKYVVFTKNGIEFTDEYIAKYGVTLIENRLGKHEILDSINNHVTRGMLKDLSSLYIVDGLVLLDRFGDDNIKFKDMNIEDLIYYITNNYLVTIIENENLKVFYNGKKLNDEEIIDLINR